KDGALLSCGAGLQSFHVDPRGMLWSCEALPLDGSDLRRNSFRDAWYGTVGRVRERRAAAANVCASCDLKSMCDRCPATALLETGSPDRSIPHFCDTTHPRAALPEDREPGRRSRYLEHADTVAAGWTPPGAILPRASRLVPASCASGGCGSGCGKNAPSAIAIDLPTRRDTVR